LGISWISSFLSGRGLRIFVAALADTHTIITSQLAASVATDFHPRPVHPKVIVGAPKSYTFGYVVSIANMSVTCLS
jgi:hypothetical protein